MSSKKLKYSNNCNRESGVHFDPPYTTWVITALKIIFRWPPMETAVLRPQKRAHPGVWEKRHTKHPEKRLWLIDVLPMRPQRTDFSLWLRRVQPIREWQNVCIHNGSRWGHLTLRSSLYRFCRCLLYILIPVQSTINQGAQKKKTFEQRLDEAARKTQGARREERLFTGEICTLPSMTEFLPLLFLGWVFCKDLSASQKAPTASRGVSAMIPGSVRLKAMPETERAA